MKNQWLFKSHWLKSINDSSNQWLNEESQTEKVKCDTTYRRNQKYDNINLFTKDSDVTELNTDKENKPMVIRRDGGRGEIN